MTTIRVVNNVEMIANGVVHAGKQGKDTDGWTTPLQIAADGLVFATADRLNPNTVRQIFDATNDTPNTWKYLFLWATGECELQMITATGSAIVHVAPLTPFCLSSHLMLASGSSTPITGGSPPTLVPITAIVLGNYTTNQIRYYLLIAS